MIIFKNFNLSYGEKVIFNNFNLRIADKDKILFTAPSGGGKSSLIKSLLGFEKLEDENTILYNDTPLTIANLLKLREHIAYVSQDVDLREEILGDLLKEIFNYKINHHCKYNEQKFIDLASFFNLDSIVLTKNVNQLSGGERQRVGIIISLLLEREILILDEPTSALDKGLKNKVVDYILDLDKTVIIISHDDEWHTHHAIQKISW